MNSDLPLLSPTAPRAARAAAVAAGAVAMALGSQIAVPYQPIYFTAQTYVAIVLAGLMGGRLTFAALVLWLAAGALGLPVLSAGRSGIELIMGPSLGYILGFLLVTLLAGDAVSRRSDFLALFAIFMMGHGIILLSGAIGLLLTVGAPTTFRHDVMPYLPGAVLKSAAAALTLRLVAVALRVRARLKPSE